MSARVLVTRGAGSWPELSARFAPTSVVLQWDPTTVQVAPENPAPGVAAAGRLDRYDWLVATSARGVDALAALLAARTVTGFPPGLRIAAVGPKTAAAFEAHGHRVDVIAGDPSSAGLARTILPGLTGRSCVLVVAPEGGPSELALALRGSGAAVDEIGLYRTVASERAPALASAAIAGRFQAVVFTAPSTLSLWLDGAGERRDALAAALATVGRVAIGKTTAARLIASGLPAAEIADAPGEKAVGDAIARVLCRFDLLT